MKLLPSDTAQNTQRVRVGMTGLALIVVLIGLGSAIFTSASDEPPVDAAGAAKSDVVANITLPANAIVEMVQNQPEEPLAELGVAPSTSASEPESAAKVASQIAAEKQKDSSKVR